MSTIHVLVAEGPMDLEIRHLKLVAAVAETGSVTRAGNRLHLTQSALSHQLRDAEEQLGAPLFEDDVVIVVPRKHRLAAKNCAAPEDFAAENILLYPPKSDSTLLTKILGPAGIQPRKIQEVMLTEVILEMVIGGLGIAALPRWAVGPQLAAGTLIGVPLQPPGYRWQWSIAQLRGNHPAVYVQEFIRVLAESPMLADFFPRAPRSRRRLPHGKPTRSAATKSSLA